VGMLVLTNSCKEDFLNVLPNGALDANVLANADGVDALLISTYSMLDGVASNGFGWEAASSNWVYGSIRGLEANKGTDAGDQPDINPIQTYSENSANPYLNIKWRSVYDGVARANSALRVLATAEENGTVTTDQATSFRNQAKALRGYFHLEAYRLWADMSTGKGVPYVDENTDQGTLTNDVDIRQNILDDLEAGTALPDNMGQIGRFNGTVAKVLYAKALMQLNVGGTGYADAKPILQGVVGNAVAPSPGTAWSGAKKPNGTSVGLDTEYGAIFDASNRNTSLETIYTVQYSVNDGSGGWNGGWGEVLNFPYKPGGKSPGGCCGFFQPSHDFVNSFLVTSSGLPYLDNSYNTTPVSDDQGLAADPAPGYTEETRALDPRLDWSVGRRGIPYLDWGVHTGSDWIRDQSYAGPFSPKKQVYKKGQEGQLTEVGNWTSGWTANGYRMIRAADVVLLLAECQIWTGDLTNGLANINVIRNRAKTSKPVTEDDGTTPAANYDIEPYTAFANADEAKKALQFERKLELGMEGHRYFDLQRWGIVQSELSRILTYEKTERSLLYGSATVGAEDVNYPIPQQQIDITNGKLKQNR